MKSRGQGVSPRPQDKLSTWLKAKKRHGNAAYNGVDLDDVQNQVAGSCRPPIRSRRGHGFPQCKSRMTQRHRHDNGNLRPRHTCGRPGRFRSRTPRQGRQGARASRLQPQGPLDGQLHLVGEVAVLAVHADLVIVFYIHGFLQNSGSNKAPEIEGPEKL